MTLQIGNIVHYVIGSEWPCQAALITDLQRGKTSDIVSLTVFKGGTRLDDLKNKSFFKPNPHRVPGTCHTI